MVKAPVPLLRRGALLGVLVVVLLALVWYGGKGGHFGQNRTLQAGLWLGTPQSLNEIRQLSGASGPLADEVEAWQLRSELVFFRLYGGSPDLKVLEDKLEALQPSGSVQLCKVELALIRGDQEGARALLDGADEGAFDGLRLPRRLRAEVLQDQSSGLEAASREKDYLALVLAVQNLSRERRYDEALALLGEALEATPEHPALLAEKAWMEYLRGGKNAEIADLERQIQAISGAKELPRLSCPLALEQAHRALAAGKSAEGERLLRAQLAQDPMNTQLLVALTQLLRDEGRLKESQVLINQAQEQLPSSPILMLEAAWIDWLMDDGEALGRRIAAAPGKEATLLGRSVLQLVHGQCEEAVLGFSRWASRGTTDAEILRALCLERLDRGEEGLAVLRRVIEERRTRLGAGHPETRLAQAIAALLSARTSRPFDAPLKGDRPLVRTFFALAEAAHGDPGKALAFLEEQRALLPELAVSLPLSWQSLERNSSLSPAESRARIGALKVTYAERSLAPSQ